MASEPPFKIYCAPMQGLTEAEFRHSHSALFSVGRQPVGYVSPFVRVENGTARRRDLRDVTSELNSGLDFTPQIICKDLTEFRILTDTLAENGFSKIDVNMGCPFRPQVKHGRGAGLPGRLSELCAIAEAMTERPEIQFSVKMRLGVDYEREWESAMPVINRMPLSHLTIHPRTASQQYAGQLHLDEVEAMINATPHPVIFNGEITRPADIDKLSDRFPRLHGVMIGRGLLMRPTLIAEWVEGVELGLPELKESVVELHNRISECYAARLASQRQLIDKLRPFWEYFSAPFDRKQVKAIVKSNSAEKYFGAVRALQCR